MLRVFLFSLTTASADTISRQTIGDAKDFTILQKGESVISAIGAKPTIGFVDELQEKVIMAALLVNFILLSIPEVYRIISRNK
ncbi:MAG: hypothetical protein ABH826_02590 [Patescibacteria group bacterium]|nr:hypothetical protein [Patescibacteria group bacterium]